MQAPLCTIIGNWKMNGTQADLKEWFATYSAQPELKGVSFGLCPPAPLIPSLVAHAPQGFLCGGQDCHSEAKGAFTGDTSAALLKDLGCQTVIVGHSERRTDHKESDALVKAKAQAADQAGLRPIICIGETLAEREAGKTIDVLTTQLQGSVPDSMGPQGCLLAYEPVWAIGTGKTPTLQEITEAHQAIRQWFQANRPGLGDVPLLYGGSVKPENAQEILSLMNVDGALVGGASLQAASLYAIGAAGALHPA